MRSFIKLILLLVLTFFTIGSLAAQNEWIYVSPEPGSEYINPENRIALRTGDLIDIASVNEQMIKLSGTKSGNIPADFKLSKDGKTLIFIPSRNFQYKEKVFVSISKGVRTLEGKVLPALTFDFTIKAGDNKHLLRAFYQSEEKERIKLLQSAPLTRSNTKTNINLITYGNYGLPQSFPEPQVSFMTNPHPGYAFCTPRPVESPTNTYAPYNLIIDKYGTPLFYREWHMRTSLLQVIPGNRLVYGQFDEEHPEECVFYTMNNKYEHLDTLTMGNGYIPDRHAIYMYANGNHLLISYDAQQINMSKVVPGGNPNATVIGLVIQELDANHNVVFQWRSWDHFEITDAVGISLTAPTVDYVHANSINPTPDGHFVVSCRNMCEVTKINRNTGEIIWRLGKHAKNNTFTIENDPQGFYWQHDAIYYTGDTLSVYNNDTKQGLGISRPMKYIINEEQLNAGLVWTYMNIPPVYAPATGSSKLLDKGNMLICWGFTWPVAYTEVNINRIKQWEVEFPENIWQYQVFKDDWETGTFSSNSDTIDFGNNEPGTPATTNFVLSNHTDEEIQINSASHHEEVFQLITSLPATIPAQGSLEMTVQFLSHVQDDYDDILTFNCDGLYNGYLNQRIASQVALTGSSYNTTGTSAETMKFTRVFPVPFHSKINLVSKKHKIGKIKIYTLEASCLREYNNFSEDALTIDLSSLPPGIYLLEIYYTDSYSKEVHRVVKY
ncbi:MAG: aryl-sulfate sulfotransferase [Bacteroidales bacterium]|nr:aryl-sulfate sulfotransferase [Bacteroidales bacterium]